MRVAPRMDTIEVRIRWVIVATLVATGLTLAMRLRRETSDEPERIRCHYGYGDDRRDYQRQLERLLRDLNELGKRVDAATEQVLDAQGDAERKAATDNLAKLRREKAEMEARIQAAKATIALTKHKAHAQVSVGCQNNPLAKGCM
jgi:hypothetical protein